MSNRKAAEAYIINYISKITLNDQANIKLYKDLFAAMDDAGFDRFINDLESGQRELAVVIPNFGDTRLSVKNNLEIGDELNVKFFTKLWIGANGDEPAYLTPIEYLVVDLPVRRASQLVTKKISLPMHNKQVDMLTHQPTGESKGARVSYPEMENLVASGLDQCVIELMKVRGGDTKAFNAMNAMMSRYGRASLKAIQPFAGGVESTRTLNTYLAGAMIESNA